MRRGEENTEIGTGVSLSPCFDDSFRWPEALNLATGSGPLAFLLGDRGDTMMLGGSRQRASRASLSAGHSETSCFRHFASGSPRAASLHGPVTGSQALTHFII